MVRSILRSLGALLLSLAVIFALLIAVEGVSAILHPWPEDFGGTREEVAQQVASYPTWVLAFLGGVGYGLIMFTSTWLATRLGTSRHAGHGYGIAAVFLGLVIMNLSLLPYPTWYWFFMLTVLPIAGYLGISMASAHKAPAATPGPDASE